MIPLLLLLFAAPLIAAPTQRAFGWCEQGGQTVAVPGNPVSTTKVQRSYPQCTVTVYLSGTLTLATIYSDSSSTALGNPFTSSTTGFWSFFADTGTYDAKFSGAGISTPFTISTVTAPSGGGAASGTVTSIATTTPVAGGTITATGTISCPTCTTNAAALTANLPVIGAGSQAAAVGTRSGNTTAFVTTTGTQTSGRCVEIDASGNHIAGAAVCGTGTGTVNSGTSGQLGYYASTAAAISGNPNFNVASGALTAGITGSVQGQLKLTGITSGTITITGASAAGTWSLTLPTGAGTNKYLLQTNGSGVTSWAQADLAASVTGILPAANGGTGVATNTIHGFLLGQAANPVSALVCASGWIPLGQGAADPVCSATPILGLAGTTAGKVNLSGLTSGVVTIQGASVAGTWSMTLPTTGGTNGYMLTTNGSGVTTWTVPNTGTVSSIATTTPITGGTITTTGTIACATCVTSAAALTVNRLVLGGAGQASSVLGSLGTTTTVLHGNAAGAPTFGAVALATDVSGTLPVVNGGTGATTLTGLLQGNGTSAVTGITNSSTVGEVLRVTGASTYAWGALNLSDTDAITGTLPVGNGGTGLTAGTSGGVLAYTAAGTLASSGALTANLPVIGGGAGVAPTVGTRSGNTTAFVTTTGSQTSGRCVEIDASGNHIQSAAGCGGSGSVTSVSFTGGLIAVGTPTTTPALTVAGTSGGIPYFSGASTWASSAALTVSEPVIGGGVGAAPTVGTRSGNTTQFVTTTGSQTLDRCVKIDVNGNHVQSGSACSATGGGPGNGAIATKAFADSPYSVITSDYTILCNAVGGNITLNLPVVAGNSGTIFNFKKIDSTANTCTVDGSGAETIDGALTVTLGTQYQSIQIITDASAWYIL